VKLLLEKMLGTSGGDNDRTYPDKMGTAAISHRAKRAKIIGWENV